MTNKIIRKLLPLLNILICAVFILITVIMVQFLPAVKETAADPPIENIHNWALFIVNGDNPLCEDYLPELAVVTENFYLDIRCAFYAAEMLEAAESDGIELRVVSAFRTWETQNRNFYNYVERLMRENDYSMEQAIAVTSTQIARPGESEHNAGVAIDIISKDWFIYNNDYTRDFDKTPEFRWLYENSWRFGFILRYPDGKEDITGFIYEPWHYRFVGQEAAELIFETGLTLEEYLEM
jgi:D-alanyl-D-alanine carboxypeptidase